MDAAHSPWPTQAARDAAAAGQFGDLIRMTRQAKRLSLVQAGTLLGYSASTLSRIETGKRKLSDVTQLRRFADVLGIPPILFGLAPSATVTTAGAPSPPASRSPTTLSGTIREGGDGPVRRR